MHNLPPIYYIIFTAVTALGVLLQAFVLLAIFFAVRKAAEKLHKVTDEALPAIASTKSLLEDISPKLKVAVSNLTEVSHTLRHQANHLDETVETLLNKTNAQVKRVDAMVTGAFDAMDHASKVVEGVVAAPARRVSGVIQGLKAGVEVFLAKKPAAPEVPKTEESSEKKKPA
jgi:methyl-accepting chemotaxis protein